jgi:hypothetical protein
MALKVVDQGFADKNQNFADFFKKFFSLAWKMQ